MPQQRGTMYLVHHPYHKERRVSPETPSAESVAWRLAAGTRTRAGVAGVDSGTMAIATARFPSEDDVITDGEIVGGALVSRSGYGDGSYAVLVVASQDGTRRGVEVVFLSKTMDAAVQAALLASIGTAPPEDELGAYYNATLPEPARSRVEQYLLAEREVSDRVWESELLSVHPADDAEARLLGEVVVRANAEIGDPCYGSSSVTVALPPGTYQAVVWEADSGLWGRRVARIGLYAQPGADA